LLLPRSVSPVYAAASSQECSLLHSSYLWPVCQVPELL
jgi:hypothetical protein